MYTKRGQIAQVKQGTTVIASYSYDYRNRRTRKNVGGVITVYHYDQWDHLIAETTTANVPLKTYAYRDDVPVAQIEHGSTPKVVYLNTDNLGTPRAGRDSQRLTVWSWNSDAFGSTVANSDPDGNSVLTTVNLRLPSQYYDAESGLHYNNQRFYDPKLGRYLQSDPIGLAGGVNTYFYANDNPARFIDPSGLAVVCGSKPFEECKVILDIDRGPPSFCGAACTKINGRFAVLTCSPYLINASPRCICWATPGIRG